MVDFEEHVLIVNANEFWDPVNEIFVTTETRKLVLKHSLRSVVRYECKTEKSFFSKEELTNDELRSYIRCMTTNGNFDWITYEAISSDQIMEVANYIDKPMTASTFYDLSKYSNRYGTGRTKIVTAESVYSAMIALGIPFECEDWHLNRLVALIRFCEAQNSPGKKMSQDELARAYADINKKNKARFKSKR